MKELQGAIIIGSAFQALLGYTGLMSLLVRYDFGILSAGSFFLLVSTSTCFIILPNRICCYGLSPEAMCSVKD